MKPIVLALFSFTAALPAFSESASTTTLPQSSATVTSTPAAPSTAVTIPAQRPEQKFTAFDLDFPGGTPAQLVAAIEKATGRTLNVIIPTEYADAKLPPMKMKNVTAPDFFAAMSATWFPYGGGHGSYAFKSDHTRRGDDTVWYFSGMLPPTVTQTRYFSLAPYLNAGLKVEDITTAIQTGWKMRGEMQPMALSYHKETKLLIAAGDNAVFQTIESALQALASQIPQPAETAAIIKGVVPNPTPEQDQARLKAVQEEVSRRRAEREAKAGKRVTPHSEDEKTPVDPGKTKE
jgi:hypothetical protein